MSIRYKIGRYLRHSDFAPGLCLLCMIPVLPISMILFHYILLKNIVGIDGNYGFLGGWIGFFIGSNMFGKAFPAVWADVCGDDEEPLECLGELFLWSIYYVALVMVVVVGYFIK